MGPRSGSRGELGALREVCTVDGTGEERTEGHSWQGGAVGSGGQGTVGEAQTVELRKYTAHILEQRGTLRRAVVQWDLL